MIGVLGGTGVTGSQVIAALKAKGAEFKCIVRDPAAAAEKLGGDVDLVQGDLSDPSSLDAAFAGLDTLYLLCGHSPKLAEMELNGLEAAKRAGISYLVKSSGSEKGVTADAPSDIIRNHYVVEQEVRKGAIDWAISQPNFFTSNLMNMAAPVVAMNKLITALPKETIISMVHPADVGECAAEILMDKSYQGAAYYLAGAAITMEDVVNTMSDILGREIEYVQVPPEAAKKAMEDKGMPDWLIAHMGGMMGFVAKGGMAHESDWVEKLTGHAPRTLREWLEANKGAFGG
ncbi:MAG: NmrA family NAD(P)-binding protein [Rhodospirillaceae bacterium]|jgi:(4-alkanoyl-5-oxo-2,5-dihydrofuran-3-yl)methyl phosphate reductase|nr:NmrA family NAD(P)-binding protein [Rhodospirillaceae bacterium]